MNRVPVILVDEECAIAGGEEMIKPGQILVELEGEGEVSLFEHCLRVSNILLRSRRAGGHTWDTYT